MSDNDVIRRVSELDRAMRAMFHQLLDEMKSLRTEINELHIELHAELAKQNYRKFP